MTYDDARRLTDRIGAIWPRPPMNQARAGEYADALSGLEYGTVNAALDRIRDTAKFCPSIAELRQASGGLKAEKTYTPRLRRMVQGLAQCTVEWIPAREREVLTGELLIDMPEYWDGPKLHDLSQQIREKIGAGASFEHWAREAGWLTNGKETLPPRRIFARVSAERVHVLIGELLKKLAMPKVPA